MEILECKGRPGRVRDPTVTYKRHRTFLVARRIQNEISRLDYLEATSDAPSRDESMTVLHNDATIRWGGQQVDRAKKRQDNKRETNQEPPLSSE
jgi:hypothetical protein